VAVFNLTKYQFISEVDVVSIPDSRPDPIQTLPGVTGRFILSRASAPGSANRFGWQLHLTRFAWMSTVRLSADRRDLCDERSRFTRLRAGVPFGFGDQVADPKPLVMVGRIVFLPVSWVARWMLEVIIANLLPRNGEYPITSKWLLSLSTMP
jgi:hypothetical protein